ncbi:MAG TPA: hypothetical protein VMV89_04560 [Candidatus Paceibacterota bacterium]|nr:hypothetical protein [Candidatus Paceibacterota bacterium]
MNRSLIILLGAMALGVALFSSSYVVSQRLCQVCVAQPAGGLDWLRKEYHLNDMEMSRIQKLHENYVSQCAVMCQTVAAKKLELAAALNNTTNLSPVAEQKLSELSACRTQCQSKMLQYFVQVSQNMPPTEGHRYLADMQNFSLGLQGESEQSMSPASSHEQHQP